jgi:hypothetical protein
MHRFLRGDAVAHGMQRRAQHLVGVPTTDTQLLHEVFEREIGVLECRVKDTEAGCHDGTSVAGDAPLATRARSRIDLPQWEERSDAKAIEVHAPRDIFVARAPLGLARAHRQQRL